MDGPRRITVKHGAVEDEVRWQRAASRTAEGIANIDDAQDLPDATSYLWTTMTQGSDVALREQTARRAQRERARAQDDARIREQADANAPALGREAWKTYTKYFDEPAQRRVVDQEYPQQLEHFGREVLARLDPPYLAWLKSPSLTTYLTHTFDEHDLDSGASYTALATQLLHHASGRGAVFDYLCQSIQQAPTAPEAWVARALALNHA
ncbi:hypothetical protein IXO89_13605, partial [Xanthomonas oryzae pv. oryzae]